MKQLIVLGGLLLALLAASGVNAEPPEGIPPGFAMPGIRVQALDASTLDVPTVASGKAVDAARGHWQWPEGAQVAARLVMLSDDQWLDPARKPVLQDRPVWLVTVTGIEFYGRGPTDDVNHEVNLVVDALTGEVLELFSYR